MSEHVESERNRDREKGESQVRSSAEERATSTPWKPTPLPPSTPATPHSTHQTKTSWDCWHAQQNAGGGGQTRPRGLGCLLGGLECLLGLLELGEWCAGSLRQSCRVLGLGCGDGFLCRLVFLVLLRMGSFGRRVSSLSLQLELRLWLRTMAQLEG